MRSRAVICLALLLTTLAPTAAAICVPGAVLGQVCADAYASPPYDAHAGVSTQYGLIIPSSSHYVTTTGGTSDSIIVHAEVDPHAPFAEYILHVRTLGAPTATSYNWMRCAPNVSLAPHYPTYYCALFVASRSDLTVGAAGFELTVL